MAAIGPTAFAALLWGSIVGVAAVFLYELRAVARERGWIE